MPARITLPFSAVVFMVTGRVLGFKHLQLQRHRKPILGPPIADPNQRLAAFQHRPAGQGLQAIEIGEPRSVGIQRPVAPEHLDPFAQAASATRDCGLMPVPMALAT
jgi:hypothetical protein